MLEGLPEKTPYRHYILLGSEHKIYRLVMFINCVVSIFPLAFNYDVGGSRPKEFHPWPLSEPGVNLSAHPASTTGTIILF
ncbi:hypothetical protein [Candidatus Odyssella acanthamoebae]|uniref:hypothetical protein n=1 Tax=Candidatus Odyssella acanthamoebae TaxID=91604 RepID=UPI0012EC6A4F|nr:hypothetical protein [Candidatus Paracaedibacter acanthamoebae]